MAECKHPSPIKTSAGNFCLECGHLVPTAAPKPAAKATPSASVSGAKKVEIQSKQKPAEEKTSLKSKLIKSFHRSKPAQKPQSPSNVEEKTEVKPGRLEVKKTTKIKVDSVSTPLLKHGKPPLVAPKK